MGNFTKYLEIKYLTESAGKYLKITQGEFRKVVKNSQGKNWVVKLFFFCCSFARLRKFRKPFAIHIHQFCKAKRVL